MCIDNVVCARIALGQAIRACLRHETGPRRVNAAWTSRSWMPVARGGPGACHPTNSTSGFDGVERSGPTTCRTEVAATGTRHCQTLGARHPHRSLHGIRLPIQGGDLKERDQEQRGCMRACGEVSRDDTSMSKGIVTWGNREMAPAPCGADRRAL